MSDQARVPLSAFQSVIRLISPLDPRGSLLSLWKAPPNVWLNGGNAFTHRDLVRVTRRGSKGEVWDPNTIERGLRILSMVRSKKLFSPARVI